MFIIRPPWAKAGFNIRYSPGQWDKLSFQQLRLFPEAHGFLGICGDCGSRQKRGFGPTILDAANFLIAANSNPASIFFHKLNPSQIGAFGHSQGATGAINALKKSAGTIKTVIQLNCLSNCSVARRRIAPTLPLSLRVQFS